MRTGRPWKYPRGEHGWERKGRWMRPHASVGLSNVHWPQFWAEWEWDRSGPPTGFWVELDWGNGNSDPVWLAGVNVRLPSWLRRLMVRSHRWSGATGGD